MHACLPPAMPPPSSGHTALPGLSAYPLRPPYWRIAVLFPAAFLHPFPSKVSLGHVFIDIIITTYLYHTCIDNCLLFLDECQDLRLDVLWNIQCGVTGCMSGG